MIDAATILVADDSADDVELLKRAIHKAGLSNPVLDVRDGHELISLLTRATSPGDCECACPLLIFLDLNMPRCPGFAVLKWLRQQHHLRNLPTIVLSNSDEQEDIEQSFQLGAHGYWVKPSQFEDLVAMMRRLTELLRSVASKVEREFPVPVAA